MSRGILITFEGLDGTGKSTQARRLAGWLAGLGLDVVQTWQPGATGLGRRLRAMVLRERRQKASLGAEAELLLLLADRAQHVAEVVRPALERGAVVVSDRFADSSLAYQGYGLGIDLELVRHLNAFATGGTLPDLTLWLDLPVGRSLRNGARAEGDRIESRDLAFFERVHRGYEELAAAHPERIVRMEVEGKGRAAVHAEVRRIVEERLGERLRALGRGAGEGKAR